MCLVIRKFSLMCSRPLSPRCEGVVGFAEQPFDPMGRTLDGVREDTAMVVSDLQGDAAHR